jgi:hypothetical protein
MVSFIGLLGILFLGASRPAEKAFKRVEEIFAKYPITQG